MNYKKLLVIYDKSVENQKEIDYSPVCWDNSIHTRLDIFGDLFQTSVIFGFSAKLTFLVTLLLNNTFLNSNVKKEIESINQPITKELEKMIFTKITSSVYTSADYFKLLSACVNKFPSINQIKIFPCIRSGNKNEKVNFSMLGKVDIDKLVFTDIESFVKTELNIPSLDEFLFNDAYYLRIVASKDKKSPYEKFYRRAARKTIKQSLSDVDLVELW